MRVGPEWLHIVSHYLMALIAIAAVAALVTFIVTFIVRYMTPK